MNRDAALAALTAANIPQSSAESQLFIVERVLEKLGTSIEQHADLLRNSTTLEVRVDYLAAVFGHYAVAAAHVLVNAVTSQPRPVPPARFEGNDVVTSAVPCTVQHALDDFDARHLYERDAILATYGLSSYHLAPVRYQAIEPDTSGERRGKEQP